MLDGRKRYICMELVNSQTVPTTEQAGRMLCTCEAGNLRYMVNRQTFISEGPQLGIVTLALPVLAYISFFFLE